MVFYSGRVLAGAQRELVDCQFQNVVNGIHDNRKTVTGEGVSALTPVVGPEIRASEIELDIGPRRKNATAHWKGQQISR